MAGVPEITLARNGQRVALVFSSYADASREFDHLAELTPDAVHHNRGNGKLAIDFEGGGSLRIATLQQISGSSFDQVIVSPGAWTAEATADLQSTVLESGGVVRVADAEGAVIACETCGAELGVAGDGWTLEHHEDGTHTAHGPDEGSAE